MAEKIKLADGHLKAANYYIQHGFLGKRKAMRWASYSDNTPTAIVFGRADVTEYIDRAKARALKRAELNKDWVLNELQDVVHGANEWAEIIDVDPETGEITMDMASFTPRIRKALAGFKLEQTEKVDPETGEVVARFMKFEPKAYNKLDALAQIARVLGLNTERLEVSGAALVQELQEGRARARLEALAERGEGEADGSRSED